MNNVTIIYWSGTGNTEQMAAAVADGVKAAGTTATLMQPAEVGAQAVQAAGAIAFGCPAMGAEQLEERDFEPMFAAIEGSLSGKKVALFGSYGWGDGQWMRDWFERCQGTGAAMVQAEGLMAHETPDDNVLADCRALGSALAKA